MPKDHASRIVTGSLAKTSRRWSLAVLCAVVLAIVSLLPSGTGVLGGWDAPLAPSLQNLLHFPAYAVLVYLVLMAVGKAVRAVHLWPIVLSAAACIAYGALLECLQAAGIPGRTGSVSDLLWDTAGVATGIVVWRLYRSTLRARMVVTGKAP